MIDSIRAWIAREPLATRVGPMVLVVVAYLVARGLIDSDTADLVTALVVLGGGGGALALARAKVTPFPSDEIGGRHSADS